MMMGEGGKMKHFQVVILVTECDKTNEIFYLKRFFSPFFFPLISKHLSYNLLGP